MIITKILGVQIVWCVMSDDWCSDVVSFKPQYV